jgi:hypothetical protein
MLIFGLFYPIIIDKLGSLSFQRIIFLGVKSKIFCYGNILKIINEVLGYFYERGVWAFSLRAINILCCEILSEISLLFIKWNWHQNFHKKKFSLYFLVFIINFNFKYTNFQNYFIQIFIIVKSILYFILFSLMFHTFMYSKIIWKMFLKN